MFKVGDRVIYTGGYAFYSKKYQNKIGTVVHVRRHVPTIKEEHIFNIAFDCDPIHDTRNMYLGNLELAKETPDWEL